MFVRRSNWFVLVLAVATLAACDHKPRSSSDPGRDRWAELSPDARTRLSELRNRQTVIGGRVGALSLPPGVEDAGLAAQFAELQAAVAALEPAVADYEREIATISGEVEAALAARDKIRVKNAVDNAGPRLDGAYARARTAFDQLEPRLPAAEDALQRQLGAVQAEQQRYSQLGTTGGELELPSIMFVGDTAQLDPSSVGGKASLDRLVQLGSMCPEVRLAIAARATRPDVAAGATLARARAEAVRNQLIAAGLPAERVALAAAAPNPAPGKDRITVAVTTPCPTARPTAPPPAQQPPTPPTAERVPTAPAH